MPVSGDDSLAAAAGAALLRRGATLAVVEATAGGLLCARLVSVPGASAWFERGVVAYSAKAKRELTGIAAGLLRSEGAVSQAAVGAMAEGLRRRVGVDFALAESGIAGPQTGRRSGKPVGSAVMAVAGPARTVTEERIYAGSRVEVMEKIAERCLELLIEEVGSGPA
jgi:nicotinamide-nucleotide amidase